MGIRFKDLPKAVQARIRASQPNLPKRRSKYGNAKTVVDGHTFDSKLEASVYRILKLEEQAGLITDIERQVDIPLVAGIIYRADFRVRYLPTGERVIVEAKGKPTDVWRIKRKLFLAFGKERLRVFEGSHRRPTELETLVPDGLQSGRLR